MNMYTIECTCGHDLKVQAEDREEAVAKAKGIMNEGGIADHYEEYHKGEPVPSVDEVHAHIAQDITEAVTA